jgi:hypothetical protein
MESVPGVDGNRAISLFSNEWFANLKAELKKLEEMELRTEGKKTLSNGLKVALSYKFLATAALDNVIIPKMNLTNIGRTIFLSSSPTSLAFFLITILLLVPVLTATTVFAQEIPPIISGVGGGSLGLPSSAITYSGVPHNTTTAAPSSHAPTSTEESPLRVAFVKPSFTYAAYSLDGFYTFYDKHSDETDETTNVTTDLNMLTVEVPDETYIHYKDDSSDPPTVPAQQEYYDTLRGLVEQRSSSSSQNETVSIKDDKGGGNGDDLPPIQIADITDKEVHEGKIFDSAGNNAYDVLFLFHQEYVTQQEYDNLKRFVVQNGGTIVFNTANTFCVEVKYDSADNTVTLVRGHTWAYDGNSSAWRAYPRERWINETQQWVGSNFMLDPQSDDVTFSNNPFNYKHSEEQFITNPNATIIHDFEVTEDTTNELGDERVKQYFPDLETVVATYEMISGKGKVINLGIFGHTMDDNEAFLKFYDEEILSRALG